MTHNIHKTVDDMEGITFGRFVIARKSSTGPGWAAYQCLDTQSTYRYSLRLPVTSAGIVESLANSDILATKADDLWKSQSRRRPDRLVSIFAIQDEHYLLPASNPFVRARALTIDQFLQKVPADDLHLFGLWETIALQMMSDAHEANYKKLSEESWQCRWGPLAGGRILMSAITSYMDGGDLSRTQKMRVIDRIKVKSSPGPELAENLLLRLAGALFRGKIEPEALVDTILCGQFRRNVTSREVDQLRAAQAALRDSASPLQAMVRPKGEVPDDLKLEMFIKLMETPPSEDTADETAYVVAKRPDVSKCELYLEAA
jgi:hypothetical protein